MVLGVRIGVALLLIVGFVASCVGMIALASQLADPMTHMPVDRLPGPFPVVVVKGSEAWVEMTDTPHNVAPPPVGASYLVPPEQAGRVERYLREHDASGLLTGWVLRVKPLSSERQRIELFQPDDGCWGGVYEATPKTITPQYRKITGPGFLVIGPLALVLNALMWAVAILGFRAFRRRTGAAQQPR